MMRLQITGWRAVVGVAIVAITAVALAAGLIVVDSHKSHHEGRLGVLPGLAGLRSESTVDAYTRIVDDPDTATLTLAMVPGLCQEQREDLPTGMEAALGEEARGWLDQAVRACEMYFAGEGYGYGIQQLPIKWNVECVESAGWSLVYKKEPITEIPKPQPVPPAPPAVDENPDMSPVFHCASPDPSDVVCESYRNGLTEELGKREGTLSPSQAVALRGLGCDNLETRPDR